MNNEKNIAIIGLGYVGLPLAVQFGKLYNTIGYDINHIRVESLKTGIDNTLEVYEEELRNSKKLKFTSDVCDIAKSNIYIVTVPTPIDNSNTPNLKPLLKASETIASVLCKNDIIVFESTVYPGCTEEECIPVIEKISELKFNQDFFCGYSPERVNPGDKINDLQKTVKITSGSTPDIADFIDELYSEIITAGTFKAASIKVAEAAKVIENTQRDLNIALVNELSIILEKLDIDTVDVLEAAGSKWNFLKARPGIVGGHCIGVDPYYLTYKSESVGYHPEVILAGRRINDGMTKHISHEFFKRMSNNGINISGCRVGILGITFKENCPDIRNTKVVDLIEEIKQWTENIVINDPWACKDEVKAEYDIELTDLDAFQELDSLVVAVGHQQYRDLDISHLRKMCKTEKPVIADIKSLYSRQELTKHGFSIYRL